MKKPIYLESLLKGLVCALLLVFFSLLQTTLFTKFRPFGAVPDLILPLVVAVAMSEREKWGAVFGLVGAVTIESLGGSSFTILPILYTLTGYLCGILTTNFFRDSLATRALFTLAASTLRIIFTLVAALATTAGVTLPTVFVNVLLPELLACLTFAPLPHLAAKLALRHFNKPRSERTSER